MLPSFTSSYHFLSWLVSTFGLLTVLHSFALYSLLARYVNIARTGPNVADMVKMERYRTGSSDRNLAASATSLRSLLPPSSP